MQCHLLPSRDFRPISKAIATTCTSSPVCLVSARIIFHQVQTYFCWVVSWMTPESCHLTQIILTRMNEMEYWWSDIGQVGGGRRFRKEFLLTARLVNCLHVFPDTAFGMEKPDEMPGSVDKGGDGWKGLYLPLFQQIVSSCIASGYHWCVNSLDVIPDLVSLLTSRLVWMMLGYNPVHSNVIS